MTDLDLVRLCLAGDRNAQQALWKTYSGKMYSLCRRYFNREEEAQDALQESFIKVFSHLDQWRGQGPLGAWIRKVVVNTSLNLLKSSSRERLHIDVDSAANLGSDDADALSQMNEEDLIALIREMPVGYRTVFNLFAIEGYAHKEIAEQLGVTENTSKTQFLKAKHWLKNKLDSTSTKNIGA
jgi:RNA polymerase sigma factor (sigma-70 family)